MRTFLGIICFCCGICSACTTLYAQAPPAPVLTQWYGGEGFSIEWLHASGAQRYELDVALDSTFTNILPGLYKYQGFGYYTCAKNETAAVDHLRRILTDPGLYTTGATLRTFFFQLPRGYPYYVRMRALNARGISTNSNVLVLPSFEAELIFKDAFVVRTGSRQAYIPARHLRKGLEYNVTLYPFLPIFSTSPVPVSWEGWNILPWCLHAADIVGVPPIKTNLTEKDTTFTLPMGTEWAMVVLTEKGAGALSKPYYALLQPFPQQLEPYIARIDAPQFYEMLQPERIFGTPEANLFYSKPDTVTVPGSK